VSWPERDMVRGNCDTKIEAIYIKKSVFSISLRLEIIESLLEFLKITGNISIPTFGIIMVVWFLPLSDVEEITTNRISIESEVHIKTTWTTGGLVVQAAKRMSSILCRANS